MCSLRDVDHGPEEISDHRAVTFGLHFATRKPNNQAKRISFNFKRADIDGLRSALSENPLSSVICPDNDDIEGN